MSFEEPLTIVIIVFLSLLIGIFLGVVIGKKRITNSKDNFAHDSVPKEIDIRQSITQKMKHLQDKTTSDFIGLAIYDAMSDEIRWRLAVGAISSRYKRIVIRMGKGIAGEVVQLNRTIKIEKYPHDVLGKPIEYPILLVEHLKSAMAVPVGDKLRIYGVLLVGQRTEKEYTNIDEKETNAIAKEIAKEFDVANIYSRVITENTNNSQQKENIDDSLFVHYLGNKKESVIGELNYEVLDQSIVEVPDKLQELLISSVEVILQTTNIDGHDKVRISIARDESNLLIEIATNRSILNTKERFSNIYNAIGEYGGSIISYHDKDQMHFIMQIPIWSYKNPLQYN